MKIHHAAIPGLLVVETEICSDHRGAFERFYCVNELKELIGSRQIVQINRSVTNRIGAVRGLHYQKPPHAEMKFVRCLKGKVWDLVVDLRAESSTFLKWHAEELSENNRRMMVIPEGCAHGFQVLEKSSELLYLHTAYYAPSFEGGIQPTDPKLAISWPLPIQDISDRDRKHPLLTSESAGLII